MCPVCLPFPCYHSILVECDRNAIERKIHNFHKHRSDETAPTSTPKHEGLACPGWVMFVYLCFPLIVWSWHAENIFVMRRFKEVQKEYLQADQP